MGRFTLRSLALIFGTLAAMTASLESASAQGTPITTQTRNALSFYGSGTAMNTLSEMPRRSPIQPASGGQLSHSGKPFQTASTGPTISPYLNLFRDERENDSAVPSYYSFVRPQLEQQAANQQQQREIQQLRHQVQAGPQSRTATLPGAGTRARYMDTAQFYGGWQR
jgi:hypothetical protein